MPIMRMFENDQGIGIRSIAPGEDAKRSDELQRRFVTLSTRGDAGRLSRSKRLYVNRTLRFDRIRYVGFDMDYTLAHYSLRNFEELSFDLTAKRLVDASGYPEEILSIPYEPSFVIRGLVVDKRLGNLFKMDRHNHVGRVYHGRRRLSKEERRALYRGSKIQPSSADYHWIDSLFALPEAALYADIIHLFENRLHIRDFDYAQLFEDIRTAIDACHADGSLKAIVKADVGRYIDSDPELPRMLHRLRSSGKRLFVLTNSEWEYTNVLMAHILDAKLSGYPGWQKYFDFVIVDSRKPRFFTEQEPFLEVDPATGRSLDGPVTRLKRQGVYQGGSLQQIEALLESAGDEILYVGDHIYGDIIRSKRDTLWRTALIIPELEDELRRDRTAQLAEAQLASLEERRASLEQEIAELRLLAVAVDQTLDDLSDDDCERPELCELRRDLKVALDDNRRDLKAVLERRDSAFQTVDQSYNRYWGSLFKEGGQSSAFASQVETYACLYTAKVSNFLYYSPNQYLRAPRHWLAHEKT